MHVIDQAAGRPQNGVGEESPRQQRRQGEQRIWDVVGRDLHQSSEDQREQQHVDHRPQEKPRHPQRGLSVGALDLAPNQEQEQLSVIPHVSQAQRTPPTRPLHDGRRRIVARRAPDHRLRRWHHHHPSDHPRPVSLPPRHHRVRATRSGFAPSPSGRPPQRIGVRVRLRGRSTSPGFPAHAVRQLRPRTRSGRPVSTHALERNWVRELPQPAPGSILSEFASGRSARRGRSSRCRNTRRR